MTAQSFGEGGKHNIRGALLVSRYVFSRQVNLDDLPVSTDDTPCEWIIPCAGRGGGRCR